MANEIQIVASGKADLGDIDSAVTKTEKVIVQSMGSSEEAFATATRTSGKFGKAMDMASGAAGSLGDAAGAIGDAVDSAGAIMSKSARDAEELAQAQSDVAQAALDAEQALIDLDQAVRDEAQSALDSAQAGIDLEQALIDQTTAQEEYNAAVKKFGANSAEARQAQVDLKQAQLDAAQAGEDALQAQEDLEQAQLDSKQATQDNTQAQNDLAAAQRELGKQGSVMKQLSDWGGLLSGVLGGLVGIIGVITAAQWAWNIAMTANPIGLIIAAIAVLIGIIILIATKTTWFQDLWNAIWSKIGDPIKASWEFIKNLFVTSSQVIAGHIKWVTNFIQTAFKFAIDFVVNHFKFMMALPGKIVGVFRGIGESIFAPFKWAFNSIANMWNRTVGKLNFSVPGWVPGIGGNSFSMPRLPALQHGGEIMRTGAVLAHKGERLLPASTRGLFNDEKGMVLEVIPRSGASRELMDLIIELLAFRIRTEGFGDPSYIGITHNVGG